MAERDPMHALGDLAREEEREAVPEDLARPFDAGELDRMAASLALGPAAPKRVVSLSAWKGRALGLLLVAAAALFFVRSPGRGAGLPTYELAVEGASQEERGGGASAAGDVLPIDRGGRLVLVARPHEPTSADARAAVWVQAPGNELTRWNVTAERSAEGAFRIDAAGPVLGSLPTGASRLLVFVGAGDDRLPSDSASAAQAAQGRAEGVQVLAQAIDVRK